MMFLSRALCIAATVALLATLVPAQASAQAWTKVATRGWCKEGFLGERAASSLEDCQDFCISKDECKYASYMARGSGWFQNHQLYRWCMVYSSCDPKNMELDHDHEPHYDTWRKEDFAKGPCPKSIGLSGYESSGNSHDTFEKCKQQCTKARDCAGLQFDAASSTCVAYYRDASWNKLEPNSVCWLKGPNFLLRDAIMFQHAVFKKCVDVDEHGSLKFDGCGKESYQFLKMLVPPSPLSPSQPTMPPSSAKDVGSGHFRILHAISGQCVRPAGNWQVSGFQLAGDVDGENVPLEIDTCSSGSHLHFEIQDWGKFGYNLKHVDSGKCVSPKGGIADRNGVELVLHSDCTLKFSQGQDIHRRLSTEHAGLTFLVWASQIGGNLHWAFWPILRVGLTVHLCRKLPSLIKAPPFAP